MTKTREKVWREMGPKRFMAVDAALETLYDKFAASPVVHADPTQRFLISKEIQNDFDANPGGYYSTFLDMLELGIAQPPFESFTVWRKTGDGYDDLVDYYPDGIQARILREGDRQPVKWGIIPVAQGLAVKLFVALIVLLATPNVVKDRQGAKKLRLGQSSGGAPCTTILRIGKVEYEDGGISVPGVEPRDVRPHLRRGHIRNQVCGEGRAERKKIFVPPCFVNGDPAFHPKRDHYEVRVARV